MVQFRSKFTGLSGFCRRLPMRRFLDGTAWAVSAGLLLSGSLPAETDRDVFEEPPVITDETVEAARAAIQAREATDLIFIREIRVIGNTVLDRKDVERAIYPHLGPAKTYQDVERARMALMRAYREAGYQTVTVEVPPQKGTGGIFFLKVVEARVSKLRVTGSRFSDIEKIREAAPSMAEGSIPNYDDLVREIVDLNKQPGRSVTPDLLPGEEPGTVEIELKVEDELPLSGSIELNNRSSSGTTDLRLSGSASYGNLWQLGHTLGGSVQTSPQDWDDVFVYSTFYMAPVPAVDGLSLMFQYLNQNTDVSTIGGSTVIGDGDIFGLRAIYTLPTIPSLYHTVTLGVDHRRFNQEAVFEGESSETPIEYYPLSLLYTAFAFGPQMEGSDRNAWVTELLTTFTYGVRGFGSDVFEFDTNRFDADGSFFTIRAELGHTQVLPADFEIYGKVQGQFADSPLISNEQFGIGGLNTVRGYLEAEAIGDRAIAGSLELRSPDLLPWFGKENVVRAYGFLEGGSAVLLSPLPEQVDEFDLASAGIGARAEFLEHFSGQIDLAFPLIDEGETEAGDPRLLFLIRGNL